LLKLTQQIATSDFTIGAIGLPEISKATKRLGKMSSAQVAFGAKQMANQFQFRGANDSAANAYLLLHDEKKIRNEKLRHQSFFIKIEFSFNRSVGRCPPVTEALPKTTLFLLAIMQIFL
jgi:hypothetical protein